MHIYTATAARTALYKLINQVAEPHKPIRITGKQANAVLVSEEDWSAIQETLYLLSVPGLKKSIKEGLEMPLDKCDEDLKW